MFIVAAGALYFGTRETYLVAIGAAIWREGYDCVELLQCKGGDRRQIVLGIWSSPFGPHAMAECLISRLELSCRTAVTGAQKQKRW
jgi:hypothetical protein